MTLGVKTVVFSLEQVELPNDLKAEKFPHFLERQNSYVSKSILGSIYDTVDLSKLKDSSSEGEDLFISLVHHVSLLPNSVADFFLMLNFFGL